MGIRFACHVCQKRLNIKRQLAGRRGVCPGCAAKIRIPLDDAEMSTPVDAPKPVSVGAASPSAETSPDTQPSELPREAANAEPGGSDLLAEDSEAVWYVRPPSGGQYGPASVDVLKQWITEGRVAKTALLWREGWPQWRDASDVLPQYASELPQSAINTSGPSASPIAEVEEQPLPQKHARKSKARGSVSRNANSAKASDVEAELEKLRRSKSIRRVTTICVLSVVAMTLLLVLAMVASQS